MAEDRRAFEAYPEAAHSHFHRANPGRRAGAPREIAESAVCLASLAASFMTGEVMTVDGGGCLWGGLWTIERPVYFSDEGEPFHA